MNALSTEELKRYARHLPLPGFGMEAQERLRNSRVLVIGAGGLGSPVLLYLAAAGLGQISIVDFDRVEVSNLQRQILFAEAQQGTFKAEAAAERIQALNPHVKATPYLQPFSRDNARELVEAHDLVIDGTDNFPTRYLSNDACVLSGKPLVYGSIYRYEGQVSVFNLPRPDGERGPNYRDLFPTPPPPEMVPNCAEGGVLGVLPGIIGSMQASEALKVLGGFGEPLDGKLFLFDAAAMISRTITIAKNPATHIERLINYEQFCNPSVPEQIPGISVQELANWRAQGKAHQLVDVRQPPEYAIANLGGELIPLEDLEKQQQNVRQDVEVVLHCRSGQRSARAVKLLRERGLKNVWNLEGGLLAWAKEIDSSIETY